MDENIKCMRCNKVFTEKELEALRERRAEYYRYRDEFICPDCWEVFKALPFKLRWRIIMRESEGVNKEGGKE